MFFFVKQRLLFTIIFQQPKASQKTLKQREAEYAEARLRILGSQQPQTEAKSTVNNNNNSQKNGGGGNGQQRSGNGNGQQRSNNSAAQGRNNALPRPPNGPDGSKGFQLARWQWQKL